MFRTEESKIKDNSTIKCERQQMSGLFVGLVRVPPHDEEARVSATSGDWRGRSQFTMSQNRSHLGRMK